MSKGAGNGAKHESLGKNTSFRAEKSNQKSAIFFGPLSSIKKIHSAKRIVSKGYLGAQDWSEDSTDVYRGSPPPTLVLLELGD